MSKNKGIEQETITTIVIDGDSNEASQFDAKEEESKKLDIRLQELLQLDGVLGYIRKDDKTATVNLVDPQRNVEYALLASQIVDAAKEMHALFDVGKEESALAEFADLEILCFTAGDSTVSVFMDKTADNVQIEDAYRTQKS